MSNKPHPYYWTITIGVEPIWIADGLDLTADRVEEIMMHAYGHIRGDEFDITIDSAPDPDQMKAEQSGREVNGKLPVICPITERLSDDCTCDQCVDHNPVSAARMLQLLVEGGQDDTERFARVAAQLAELVLGENS